MTPSSSVQIPVGRHVLRGELSVPAGSMGTVLFVHGSGSSHLSPRNKYVAGVLQKHGLATLLFDLLTSEEEQQEAQSGHLRFDIVLLTQRLTTATGWLTVELTGETGPLGYFGASTGAAAALRAAALSDGRISAIVSRGGRPDLAGNALPEVKAPTLLLVGSLDTEVIALNLEAYRMLRCPKSLELIPGARHLFEEPGTLEAAAARAARWFVDHFRQPVG